MLAALALSLIIKTFFFQSFWIPTGSMQPTLDLDDRILVTQWRPGPLDLRRGDIIVFKDPGGWLSPSDVPEATGLARVGQNILTFTGLLPDDAGEHLVKRVVGLPGETVICCDADGYITVDGEPLEEPYLAPGTDPSLTTFETVVPDNYVWVLGDNRANSADSRAHQGAPGGGSIPINSIVGSAFLTAWPLDNLTVIRNPYDDPDRVAD